MKFLSGCFILFIMFFTWADSQPFIRVTVLDRESNIRRIFENPEDLRYFSDVWEDRVLVPNMKDLGTWDYQFDVMTRDKSTRWLYDSHTGLCSFLSKETMPVYYIRQFAVLNNILAAEPHEKVVWIIEERPVPYWNEPWYDRSGWWRSDRRYDDHHDHKRARRYHDGDYHGSREPAEREHHYNDRSRDEDCRDRNRDDETRRKPVPVYTPKEERRSEPERRPFVVPEKKSSEPPIKVNIDERKLPGIRGIVRD